MLKSQCVKTPAHISTHTVSSSGLGSLCELVPLQLHAAALARVAHKRLFSNLRKEVAAIQAEPILL
eukprot:333194-Pleurochrysis_carterae.AAC.1